jgi:glycosyltransferase involved in cell wall biosynthesis
VTRISVALASYNAATNLGCQLQSISEQTVLPAELIVSDDGSQDGTADIVRGFAERAPFPVRLTINSQRLGWKRNFVRAAQLCTGDVIAFCDQDDFWLPGKIRVLSELATDDSWDALVHRNAFLYETALVVGKRATGRRSGMSPSTAFYGNFDGHRMAFRRRLLPWLELQERFEDCLFAGEIAHDRLVILAALTVGRAIHVDTVLTLFRRHAAQVTIGEEKPSTADDYVARAGVLLNWIHALSEAERTGLATKSDVDAMSGVLGRLAAAHQARATLHQDSRVFGRLLALGRLMSSRSYAQKESGALGLRAFLKDTKQAIVGR